MRNYKELRLNAIYFILNHIEQNIEDGIKNGEDFIDVKIVNEDLFNDIKKYLVEGGFVVEEFVKSSTPFGLMNPVTKDYKFLKIKLNPSNYEK